jgi:hypothetical protein
MIGPETGGAEPDARGLSGREQTCSTVTVVMLYSATWATTLFEIQNEKVAASREAVLMVHLLSAGLDSRYSPGEECQSHDSAPVVHQRAGCKLHIWSR